MKIHEYQAKEILRRYGVATPRGQVTEDPAEVGRICEELGLGLKGSAPALMTV